MKVHVLTLFPQMFPGPLGVSLAGKALEKGLWTLEAHNIRDHSFDRHGTVDDTPFGGGPGMVMRPDVVHRAIEASANKCHNPRFVYMTPKGAPLTQERVKDFSVSARDLVVLCGHYEGIDQRVIDTWNFEEVSVGDYILSGGEMAALVFLDSIIRLIPGVMGHEESHREESFSDNLLEYPHYTRPQIWNDLSVPEVLLSGHHKNIRAWRQEQSELITQARRPDLWERYCAPSSTLLT